jgi:hypothetical protein
MNDDMAWTRRTAGHAPPEIDTSVAHSARVYDFILGGKDNYPPDRAAAEKMLAGWPSLRISMRENRKFMHRAARYVAKLGVDQFLDVGTGIPTSPNLHEVVQDVNPRARVVYVDNDPIVLAHAGARLHSTEEGRTAYIHADMKEPEAIIADPELTELLDMSRPVGLSIIAAIQYILDDHEAQDLVKRYLALLPAGSYLALSTVTHEDTPQPGAKVLAEYAKRGIPVKNRTKAEVAPLFDGLEVVDPGLTLVHAWRPVPGTEGEVLDTDVAMYGGVGFKR